MNVFKFIRFKFIRFICKSCGAEWDSTEEHSKGQTKCLRCGGKDIISRG